MKLKNKIQSWEIDGAAYPERLHLRVTGNYEAIMEIRAFMESTKPAGIPDHIQQQANAWMAVCSALDEAAPDWRNGDDNAKNMAVAAIMALAGKSRQESEEHTIIIEGVTLIARGPQGCGKTRLLDRIREVMDTPKAKPLKFDPEAAKAGAAVRWLGDTVRWLGVSDKHKHCANIVEHDGGLSYVTDRELRMAPKPKRTVWVNLYQGGFNEWQTYNTTKDAEAAASRDNLPIIARAIATAIPIEIDV